MATDLLIQIAVWGALSAFGLCLFATVKRKVPITGEEAKLLWKIHKQDKNCGRHRWKTITEKNGKITGFKCECGYKYLQKGHFLSNRPKTVQTTQKARTVSAKSIAKFYASANQQEVPKPLASPNRARASR